METTYNIEGAKVTALEISVLYHIFDDHGGVWEPDEDETDDVREQLDYLVLEGFLERDFDYGGWLNVWRVTDDAWSILEPNTAIIRSVIKNIADS